MVETEATTAELLAEVTELRQRNAMLEAAVARWQHVDEATRLPTLLQELGAAYQRLETLQHLLTVGEFPADQGMAALGQELATTFEELHIAAEELHQQHETLRAASQAVEAERQRYRDFFDFAPDGYLVTDRLGHITAGNQAAATLFNVPQKQLLRKPLTLFVAAEDRQTFRARLQALQSDTPRQEWEIRLQPWKRALFPAVLTVGTVRLPESQQLALQWLVRDLTEQKRLEAQLRNAHTMQALGTLAGGMAHDFNNLLGMMLGFTELVIAELPPASAAVRSLQQVLTAGHRAEALVRQILTFSRCLPLERLPVPVHSPIHEALRLLQATLPTKITIREYLDPEVVVLGDTAQLYQVMMHLGTNAADAMRKTGGMLEVLVEAVQVDASLAAQHPALHPGPYVRLTVRDTGEGIAPDVLAHIYEPFFTTKEVGQGTGMGLAVVQGIVEQHGGTILVQSTPAQGTTFTIYLPRLTPP
jgi:PAS domain S-box-containing protein